MVVGTLFSLHVYLIVDDEGSPSYPDRAVVSVWGPMKTKSFSLKSSCYPQLPPSYRLIDE